MTAEELRVALDAWIGREGEPVTARDPVNVPMIRHWCDAVEDRNPVYTDPEFAAKSVHGAIVAPPTMLQAWSMAGLRPPGPAQPAPFSEVMRLLDAAGYTSVVATNCRQEYSRYLKEGDLLNVTTRVAAVSDEKTTALGAGRFVDEEMIYRDAAGEEVARMTFRLLKFKPPAAGSTAQAASAAPARIVPPRRRPRPAQSPDNAFFWQGVAAGELRIQRCTGCQALRHPPGPMCPCCHSLDWDYLAASGRGHVYSFVVAHHPPVPPFSYPNAIALIELDEGTRLVSNLVGIDPADVAIGLRVRVEFTKVDDELVLPLFRPDPS